MKMVLYLLSVRTSFPSTPNIRGIDGPQRSMSNIPTLWPLAHKVDANCTVAVLLPTPPLPDKTTMVSPTPDNTVSEN